MKIPVNSKKEPNRQRGGDKIGMGHELADYETLQNSTLYTDDVIPILFPGVCICFVCYGVCRLQFVSVL